MASSDKLFLSAQRFCVVTKRFVRDRFRPSVVASTGAAKTFNERLREMEKTDEVKASRVNIGLPPTRMIGKYKISSVKWHYNDSTLSRHSVLNDIASEWLSASGPVDAFRLGDHYNIFQDLFGNSYFYPQFDWRVSFNSGDDNENGQPVLFGNKIAASECLSQPSIEFSCPLSFTDSSYWCVLMTSLDGHLTDSKKEYVLWMAANLPSGEKDPLSKAETIIPYVPPFPCHGIGYCRVAIVLYRQDGGRIKDPKEVLLSSKVSHALKSRDFSTIEWYGQRQDIVTPGSLRFFQTLWDDSVTGTFHDIFNMKEPRFEYMTPEPFREEQLVRPPEDVPFNEYLDRYRDRKDISEEVLKYYLYSMNNPLGAQPTPSKYPNLKRIDPRKVESWIRDEEKNKNLRLGKWKTLPPPL